MVTPIYIHFLTISFFVILIMWVTIFLFYLLNKRKRKKGLKEKNYKKLLKFTILITLAYVVLSLVPNAFFALKTSSQFDSSIEIGDLSTFFIILILVLIGLYMVYLIDRKHNLKFMGTKAIEFTFLIFEIILAGFAGLLFIDFITSGNLDFISIKIFIAIVAFFLFVVLEIIKNKYQLLYAGGRTDCEVEQN